MANSVPSVVMDGSWQNVYSLTGYTLGAKLIIQNKSSKPCLIWISGSSPIASFDDGFVIDVLEEMVLTAGEAGCFVKGNGPLFVQLG